jgi:hypothetical protein
VDSDRLNFFSESQPHLRQAYDMRTTTLVALTTTKAVIFNDLAKCAPHPSADVNGDQAAGLMVELSVGILDQTSRMEPHSTAPARR